MKLVDLLVMGVWRLFLNRMVLLLFLGIWISSIWTVGVWMGLEIFEL